MGSQKRFEATRRKKEKARSDGDVAKSTDLSSFLGLSCGSIYILGFSNIFKDLYEFFTFFFGFDTSFTSKTVYIYASGFLFTILAKLLLLFFVVLVGVVLCEVIQVGVHFSFKSMVFNLSRLSPWKNLTQRFGLTSNDGENIFLGKITYDCLKIITFISLIAISTLLVLYNNVDYLFQGNTLNFQSLISYLARHQITLILIGGMCIGIGDLLYQKHKRNQRLMMDIQELKQEMKESEGDPEILARRKMLHKEIASHEIIQSVRQAKVVIVDK